MDARWLLFIGCKKCHGELAGGGVEYSWACAKNVFWRKPIRQKRADLFKAKGELLYCQ